MGAPHAERRSVRGPKFPHYRLEQPATDFPVAQSMAGYLPVPAKDADTFPTRIAALIASAGAGLDVVRVDA
jgi:hypothetical protein